MGLKYVATVLIFLLTVASAHAQANDRSSPTVRKPLENLKSLTDQFNFLENDNLDNSSIHEFDELDLDQLLNAYLVFPEIEFNLTETIRSQNKDKTVILWGGVLPFFSIPDPDKRDKDSSFSKENFSIFWHLKKRF